MNSKQKLALTVLRLKFRILTVLSARKAAHAAFLLFCTPRIRNKKEAPPAFETAEMLELTQEGHKIRGYRWNPGGSKKVLILHGFESAVVNFEPYITPLLSKGYEILAFDALGHGRSEGRQVNILQYMQLINQINLNYGPVTSFIAHSFGGLTATLFLESIPHDYNYRLVLIAPATETNTAANQFFNLLNLRSSVRVEFDRLIEKIGNHKPEWYSIRRAADNIRAQVLFLQDKEDTMTPYEDVVPIIKKNLPNFRFIITEGLGHRRIYRDDKNIEAICRFL